MIHIRPEEPSDLAAIYHVNEQAFGQMAEARLVEKLRARQEVTLSLVAVQKGYVLGHILFSPVAIDSGTSQHPATGLGPLAVLPEFQNRGIGSLLLESGLEECRRKGHESVVVLGHPAYYSRFGFMPASRFGLRCEFDVPQDAFMAIELRRDALRGKTGIVSYQPEFSGV